jgi:hypothetical protein
LKVEEKNKSKHQKEDPSLLHSNQEWEAFGEITIKKTKGPGTRNQLELRWRIIRTPSWKSAYYRFILNTIFHLEIERK